MGTSVHRAGLDHWCVIFALYAIRDQQLMKWIQLGSSSWGGHKWGAVAEVDVIVELKWTQMGNNSWVWPRETSACQRHYRIRAVGALEYGATHGTPDSLQMWWRRWHLGSIPISAVKRELLCTLLVRCPALTWTDVRAPQTSALWREP